MEEYITRAEFEEYKQRMSDEHARTNHRLKSLEEWTTEIRDLTVSVKELTLTMKQMLETQNEQSERLCTLEGRDGENWRTVVKYLLTAVLGAAVTFIFTHI